MPFTKTICHLSFPTMVLHKVLFLPFLLSWAATASTARRCTNHAAKNGIYVEGPVDVIDDPLANFDAPKLATYNRTAVEDWSHDAVSEDGSMGLAFTYSRGSVGPAVAAQRVFLSVVWPNGTRYMEFAFAEESNFEMCPDKTTGRFFNRTSEFEWKMESTSDFKHSVTMINSPTVKGTVTMKALVPPLYPNGLQYPDPKGDPFFAPLLWWEENVPTGTVEANLTINGTPLIFRGVGGRERNWNSLAWSDVCESWDMVRGVVGPYSFIGWKNKSKIEGTQFSLVLLKGNRVVFRTQSLIPSASAPFASIEQMDNGPLHLASPPSANVQLPESRFSGYAIHMVSPESNKEWRFNVNFTQTVYWFKASATAHIGGFVGNVKGGEVGKRQYAGLGSGNTQESVDKP